MAITVYKQKTLNKIFFLNFRNFFFFLFSFSIFFLFQNHELRPKTKSQNSGEHEFRNHEMWGSPVIRGPSDAWSEAEILNSKYVLDKPFKDPKVKTKQVDEEESEVETVSDGSTIYSSQLGLFGRSEQFRVQSRGSPSQR